MHDVPTVLTLDGTQTPAALPVRDDSVVHGPPASWLTPGERPWPIAGDLPLADRLILLST